MLKIQCRVSVALAKYEAKSCFHLEVQLGRIHHRERSVREIQVFWPKKQVSVVIVGVIVIDLTNSGYLDHGCDHENTHCFAARDLTERKDMLVVNATKAAIGS